jgi:capsular polysaccharide biosynthesis protein
VAERRPAAIVAACAVAGLLLGLAVTLLQDEAYRATTLLQVSSAADPRVPTTVPGRVPAEVLAESYAEMLREDAFLAGLAPQVAGGRYTQDELFERVDAEHEEGSAVIRVTAEAESPVEAQTIAADVVSSVVTLVGQLARQRAEQVQDELNRRLAQLPTGPARDVERRALAAEAARAAASGVEQATSIRVAAPAFAPDDPVRPDRVQNLAGGLLLGLVVGLGATLLRRRRPAPVAEPEPAPAAAAAPDETPPRIVLDGPEARSTVAGAVRLRLHGEDHDSGIAALELLLSDGGADWRPVARFEDEDGEAEWDTSALADGVYWLSAVAHDRAGNRAATEPLPLVVRNAPGPPVSSPA